MKAAPVDSEDLNAQFSPAELTDKLQSLLLNAKTQMKRGQTLSRADMQRLNLALDNWRAAHER